jgi:hypothetical protein
MSKIREWLQSLVDETLERSTMMSWDAYFRQLNLYGCSGCVADHAFNSPFSWFRNSQFVPSAIILVNDHANRTRCDHVKLTRG